MTANGVVIALCVFLILMAVIAIISSLADLANRKTEIHSDVETKLFKWKAPSRLIFGLVCILLVIAILKMDIFKFAENKSDALEKKISEITKENNYLKDKLNIKDSLPSYYYLTLEQYEGGSALQGRILFSNSYRTITVKGATVLTADQKPSDRNEFAGDLGNKYLLKYKDEIWGVNILQGDVNSGYAVKMEIYKESPK